MNSLLFKTNISCSGCVKAVTPFLELPEIKEWSVNVQHPDKLLTVTAEPGAEYKIAAALKKAGFTGELVPQHR